MNGLIRRENLTSGPSRIAGPPFLASAGKIARQFFGLTFRAVDIGVDRLVADTDRMAIVSEASGDLFRRPANSLACAMTYARKSSSRISLRRRARLASAVR